MRSLKSFRRGGLWLDKRDETDPLSALRNAYLPSSARILLKQHEGGEARTDVSVGDRVREGMPIGTAQGKGSSMVHASVPGIVADLSRLRLPEGGECMSVLIHLEGTFDRIGKRIPKRSWQELGKAELLSLLAKNGVVETEGRGRPLHEIIPGDKPSSHLILNAVETEPYLRTELSVIRSKAEELAESLSMAARISEAEEILAVFSEQDETETAELRRILSQSEIGGKPVTIRILKARFPQELPARVFEVLFGEQPSPERSGNSVILRPSSLLALYEALALDKPFVERFVTVAGKAIKEPTVLKARIGTRIGDLIEECGGFAAEPERILIGGPFSGLAVKDLDFPVTKRTNAVLALLPEEIAKSRTRPCIRCGRCAAICPDGIDPAEVYRLIRTGRLEGAWEAGLGNCSSCGACSYSCPSRLPMSQLFDATLSARSETIQA